MSPAPGSHLGPYEILAPLGSGGMGDVFRARDAKLSRDVALKVLPPEFASNASRLSRFEQEARAASALNHPNLITIHDIGRSGADSYLVMELVDGKTLRAILNEGPLPIKRLLAIATQIAEGLAAAHEANIVHRDLKPENVMVRSDGIAKILDFGLAKSTPFSRDKDPSLSSSPTLSGSATQPGVVLGTAGYMSPEQARGQTVDFRSDQFSLGCILYELVSGRRPFDKPSTAQTLASIIEDEPAPVSDLNPRTPAPLRWVIERCLEKDPAGRYASTRDLARDLSLLRDRLNETSSSQLSSVSAQPLRSRRTLWVSLAALAGLFLGAAAAFFFFRTPPSEPPELNLFTYSGQDSSPSASPDGQTVAFSSRRDDRSRIWLKQISSGSEVPVTEGPDDLPRFSPDGGHLLFIRRDAARFDLYRIPTVGGQPRRILTDVLDADWSPDGQRIAFVRQKVLDGKLAAVLGVSGADGSDAREIYTNVESGFLGPRWSPDGKTIAVYSQAIGVTFSHLPQIFLVDSANGSARVLRGPGTIDPTTLAWTAAGDAILYSQPRLISAAQFGGGTPSRFLLQEISTGRIRTLFWIPTSTRRLDILGEGQLVFDNLNFRQSLREVLISPRSGITSIPGETPLTRGDSNDRQPRYSPDARSLAFTSNRGGNLDVWLLNIASGNLRQLTDHISDDWDPAFTPDGKLLWSSARSGNFEIWLADADGGNARQITRDTGNAENPTMSPDGQWIYFVSGRTANEGLWKIRTDATDATRLIPGRAQWPEVSPDGKFILYTMTASSGPVIYVIQSSDGSRVPFEISVTGGGFGRARWRPDGRAIAFTDNNALGQGGVFLQDFTPGQDSTASRRPLAGFSSTATVESFAHSPDGTRVTLATVEGSINLMTASGVSGISPPRRPSSR